MNQVLAAKPAFDSVWMGHRSQSRKVPVTVRHTEPGLPEHRLLFQFTHSPVERYVSYIHKETRHRLRLRLRFTFDPIDSHRSRLQSALPGNERLRRLGPEGLARDRRAQPAFLFCDAFATPSHGCEGGVSIVSSSTSPTACRMLPRVRSESRPCGQHVSAHVIPLATIIIANSNSKSLLLVGYPAASPSPKTPRPGVLSWLQ